MFSFCTHWSFSTARRDLSRECQQIACVASPSPLCNHEENFLLSRSAQSGQGGMRGKPERVALSASAAAHVHVVLVLKLNDSQHGEASLRLHPWLLLYGWNIILRTEAKRASFAQYLRLIWPSSIRVTSSHTLRKEAARIWNFTLRLVFSFPAKLRMSCAFPRWGAAQRVMRW